MAIWISTKQVQFPFSKCGKVWLLYSLIFPHNVSIYLMFESRPLQGNTERQETSTRTDLDPTKQKYPISHSLLESSHDFNKFPPPPRLFFSPVGPPWRAPSSWYRIHKQEKQIDKPTCTSVVAHSLKFQSGFRVVSLKRMGRFQYSDVPGDYGS